MKLVANQINKAATTLTVKLAPEDYKAKVNAEVKKYAQKIRIPGFRAGNTAIIRQRYGATIVCDVIKDLLSNILKNYLKEQGSELLMEPIFDFNKGIEEQLLQSKEVEITLPLELIPKFQIELDKSIKVEEYDIATIDQEDIDAYLEHMSYIYGSDLSVEGPAQEKDTLHLEWTAQDEKKQLLYVTLSAANTKIVPDWLGKKASDQFTCPLNQLLQVVTVASKELQQSTKSEIELHVKDIRRPVPAPIDESLKKKILQGQEDKAQQELHVLAADRVREDLKRQLAFLMEDTIKAQLLSKVNIEVPPNYSDEDQGNIRFMLILQEIAKKAAIDVPVMNVDLSLLSMIQNQLESFLGRPPKRNEVLAHFHALYPPQKKEKYKRKMQLYSLVEKVVPYVKKHISVTKKTVSSTEAKKLLGKNSLYGKPL